MLIKEQPKEDGIERIDRLLRDNKRIEAIKLHRELFGSDLREAHDDIIKRCVDLGLNPKHKAHATWDGRMITIDGPDGRKEISAERAYELAEKIK